MTPQLSRDESQAIAAPVARDEGDEVSPLPPCLATLTMRGPRAQEGQVEITERATGFSFVRRRIPHPPAVLELMNFHFPQFSLEFPNLARANLVTAFGILPVF